MRDDPNSARVAANLQDDPMATTEEQFGSESANESAGAHRLERSSSDRMLSGVAGGLARYLNVDSNILRIAFVVL